MGVLCVRQSGDRRREGRAGRAASLSLPEEIYRHIHTVVLPQYVIPGWIQRVGYPGKGEDIVAITNSKVAPYIGMEIAEDGSLRPVPITKGALAK